MPDRAHCDTALLEPVPSDAVAWDGLSPQSIPLPPPQRAAQATQDAPPRAAPVRALRWPVIHVIVLETLCGGMAATAGPAPVPRAARLP